LNFCAGAHINPAVSTAFCLFGKLPFYKLPCYIFSQVLGAFVSGAAVYSVYYGKSFMLMRATLITFIML